MVQADISNAPVNRPMCVETTAMGVAYLAGLAVLVPAFIFGAASGASFNPALTLALAADGSFEWAMVPGYIIAQLAGAFCGACIVYALFKDQFDATDESHMEL